MCSSLLSFTRLLSASSQWRVRAWEQQAWGSVIDGQAGWRGDRTRTLLHAALLRGALGSSPPAAARSPRGTFACVFVCLCVSLCWVSGFWLGVVLSCWREGVGSHRSGTGVRGWGRHVSAPGGSWVQGVCVERLCLACARLSCCSALVLQLRMALLLCLRVERVAAVSQFCVALLVCVEVRDCRAMGLSV